MHDLENYAIGDGTGVVGGGRLGRVGDFGEEAAEDVEAGNDSIRTVMNVFAIDIAYRLVSLFLMAFLRSSLWIN